MDIPDILNTKFLENSFNKTAVFQANKYEEL